MACSPSIKISKYFGASSIQNEVLSLEDARGALQYFWTKDGSSNIIVSVDGIQLNSYEELAALAAQPEYAGNAFINVGLYLSNDGTKSIWPKKPA